MMRVFRFWILDFRFSIAARSLYLGLPKCSRIADCGLGNPASRLRGRERSPFLAARAFTLIELLIVVAMLSILSGAFFSVVMFTIRSEVEEGLRSTLRQEGLGVVRAIVRDTHLAEAMSGEIRSDTQTLILAMGKATKAARHAIAYRRRGPLLERIMLDAATTPTVQAMSSHVRSWRIERSGDLVRVEMELAINRYTKDFVAKYAFATRVGVGQVAGLSRPKGQNREP
jgi:prepilin-type N-terminal cleavage/methylation domain-containing protein